MIRRDLARPLIFGVGFSGEASDYGHYRIAVEKHLLDVVGEIKVFPFVLAALQNFIAPGGAGIAVAKEGRVLDDFFRGDVMCVYVENELLLWEFFVRGVRLVKFGFVDIEKPAENAVQRKESRGHSARGGKKSAAADAEFARSIDCDLDQAMFDGALFGRLVRRREFLVRDDLRRDREIQIVSVAFLYPSFLVFHTLYRSFLSRLRLFA
jgi:hypothetical protein